MQSAKKEINMNEVRTIKIKGEEHTLEKCRENWKWNKNQFLKLNVYGDDYSTTLLTKFDEVVDELIENNFNAVETYQKGGE